MCPRFYVSMSLCVHISMCPRFYVANIMPNRPFVAMVLCVQSSLWPWFYVAPDVQIDPLCRRSYVSRIQCDQCSMCPWLYVAIVYMLLYSNPNREKVFCGTVLPNETQLGGTPCGNFFLVWKNSPKRLLVSKWLEICNI